MKILPATPQAIAEASLRLSQGKLVAFPTETVYGLGAHARNPPAIERLYMVKGRPADHPVIVHLASCDQLDDWAQDIPDEARALAAALCPGPLTLILKKAPHVLSQITGGQASVGLRIPAHKVARQLLETFGDGIAAPSANRFGRLSPTTAMDVASDFECDTLLILDGGTSQIGIESTIVDFTCVPAKILRPGMILPEQIEKIVGKLAGSGASTGKATTRAPGMLAAHYAPVTCLKLVDPAKFKLKLKSLVDSGKKVCLLSFQEDTFACLASIVAPLDPSRYAHDLYSNLRKLDSAGADLILVESVPKADAWAGVADRLKRAATEDNGQG